jgi:hypothetical protein
MSAGLIVKTKGSMVTLGRDSFYRAVISDVVCYLSSVKRTAIHFSNDIAHTNDTFNRGPNQLDVLDSDITRIFGQW